MEPRWEMILIFEDRDDWFTIILFYSSPFLLFIQKADISTIVDRLTDTSKYGGTHKVADSSFWEKKMLYSLSWLLNYGVQCQSSEKGEVRRKRKRKRKRGTSWPRGIDYNRKSSTTLFSGISSEFFNTQDVVICNNHYYRNSKAKQTILIFAHWTWTSPPSLTVMWLGTSTRAPMPSQDDCSSPSPDDRSLQSEEENGSDAPKVKLWMASFVPFHKYLRLCDTSALVHSVPACVSHGPAFLVK